MDQITQQQLKRYLESLVPETTLDAAADDGEAPMRMAGTQEVTQTRAKKAQAAVQKLARGKEITEEDQFLIEAIILPDKRPVIDIKDGKFAIQHPLWVKYNVDRTVEAHIERAIRGVGRIEVPTNTQLPYAGTGFLVAPTLLMTNRHVANLFAHGVGDGTLTFHAGQTVETDFGREATSTTSNPIRVTRVRMIHPYWDMAVLELEETPAGAEPLHLSVTGPALLQDRDIAVIGYPAFDPRNNAMVQHEVFRGLYNVKRLQPGLLNARAPKLSYGNMVNAVTHDASTLGGNSGSCVLHAKTGEVVALHFAGRYQVANYAVPSFELARDARVYALGLMFSEEGASPVEAPNPWAAFWEGAETSPVVSGVGGSAQSTGSSAASGRSVTVTIPVTVTVDIGDPVQAGALTVPAVAAPASVNERLVEPVHDADYTNRTGYDPMFLGVDVPMPQATNADDLSKLDDGSHRLDYNNFSLIVNKRRRLAQISAANVDANPARTRPEPGRDYTRDGLNGFTTGREWEKWFTDPRIPAQHQLPDRFFSQDRSAFDKGHIVRRNAVVWGDTYRDVQNANGDTFHVTNCSPQVKGFNRSNLGGLWGKLENQVLREAATERLCVFAGPVLRDDDPVFAGVDDLGPVQVRIPRAYWKVIVAVSGGALQSFGFLLEQDLTDVDFEFQLNAEWTDRLVKLDELTNSVGGFKLGDAVLAADQA